MTLSRLRVCYRELDRDRHQGLPLSAGKSDPRGVMNWNVPPRPRKDSSRSQINWNLRILTCMLVITIVMLVLIEVHIQRVTIHPSFLR
jgi:hypothetical protein